MTALDKFGKFIVSRRRDKVIEQYEVLEEGGLRSPAVQALQNALGKLTAEEKQIVKQCVIDTLDTALHDTLCAFQESHDLADGIEIVVDGENVAELSGMLHSELFGEQGWYARFSEYPPVCAPDKAS